MKILSFLLPIAVAASPLPMTNEDIDTFVQHAEEMIGKEISAAVSLPDDQRAYSHVMRPWNRLGIETLGNLAVLHFLTEHELPSKEAAALALPELVQFLFKSLVLDSCPI